MKSIPELADLFLLVCDGSLELLHAVIRRDGLLLDILEPFAELVVLTFDLGDIGLKGNETLVVLVLKGCGCRLVFGGGGLLNLCNLLLHVGGDFRLELFTKLVDPFAPGGAETSSWLELVSSAPWIVCWIRPRVSGGGR